MSAQSSATPPGFWLAVEPWRAAVEHGLWLMCRHRLVREAVPGAGQPVLVLPGMGTDDWATQVLRGFLDQTGYCSHPWNQGLNLGPPKGDLDAVLDGIARELLRIHRIHGRPVAIIGWSLGGIYARELAKRFPAEVRQVITLGTPIKGAPNGSFMETAYRWMTQSSAHLDSDMLGRIATPPPVSCTSIYSRTDGVVSWLSSADRKVHCVEVAGVSHLGLVANPTALKAIANCLAAVRPPRGKASN